MDGEKLWPYATLARLWSWTLIGVAAALLALSFALQAAAEEGLSGFWTATALAVSGGTALVLLPLFRLWFRRATLPSLLLPRATRSRGPRRLEASPRDWRRWGVLTGVVVLVGGAAMLTFLVGVLGRGGTAEGVVVGMLAAWGLATLDDARRIRRIEAEEGRRYYAACRHPVSVGDHLVWVPRPFGDGADKARRVAAPTR